MRCCSCSNASEHSESKHAGSVRGEHFSFSEQDVSAKLLELAKLLLAKSRQGAFA